ncbi:MAG: alanine racemase [Bacillota bacterium]
MEVNLQEITENVRRLIKFVGPRTKLLAVVKSNGYGYGMESVARAALRGGASWLGVATAEEGIRLRNVGIAAPVLVLGRTEPALAGEVVRFGLCQSVWDRELLESLSSWSSRLNKPAKVQIEVDTGMGTSGLLPSETRRFGELVMDARGVQLEGVYTHLAKVDQGDSEACREQLRLFQSAVDALAGAGIRPGIRHACNTGGIALVPEGHLDMVRSGCGVLGMWPFQFPDPIGLKEAVAFKSRVEFVKELPEGAGVSYGSAFRCRRRTVLAGVPVGYGQGMPRKLSFGGQVLVRSRRVPIVGLICMNRFTVDVTEVPGVEPGDEVVICGEQGGQRISVAEAAMGAGIGVGEFLLPYLLPKVYLDNATGGL